MITSEYKIKFKPCSCSLIASRGSTFRSYLVLTLAFSQNKQTIIECFIYKTVSERKVTLFIRLYFRLLSILKT